jgi:NAD(P)H-hydrate epimerase
MKLVSVAQMRAIELEADAQGLTYAQMMENAGRGLAEIVHALGQENGWEEILGLIGPGNNGGDALVALTWLAEAGWHVNAYLVRRAAEDDALIERYLGAGGIVIGPANDDEFPGLSSMISAADVILDGVLGTGIRLPLKAEAAEALRRTGLCLAHVDPPPFVIAVDCPSGVDCDSGEAAPEAIRADLTITMAAVKQGLLKLPAFEYIGDLQVVDIGLPPSLPAFREVSSEAASPELISPLLPRRSSDAHKGTFGTALIIAGSVNYAGAALLAGRAAYRSGAGLVTMAVPDLLHPALAGHLPEATWLPLPQRSGFIDEAAVAVLQNGRGRATAALLGPGIGNQAATTKFIDATISSMQIPLVIDADGLRHLASIPHWHSRITCPAILTPHPGEMSALTGLPVPEIQSKRRELAAAYAVKWNQVIVLKGAFTVIASPEGGTTTIPVATPALARAGSGDVLSGLIAGLLAQGMSAYDAARAGAYLHARAGLRAAELQGTTASVLAGDLVELIGEVYREISH